jgi:hypothetical protein
MLRAAMASSRALNGCFWRVCVGDTSYPEFTYPEFTYPEFTYPEFTYPDFTYPEFTGARRSSYWRWRWMTARVRCS